MDMEKWLSANSVPCHRLSARISPARCRDVREMKVSPYDANTRHMCSSCPQAEEMDRMAGFEPVKRRTKKTPPVFVDGNGGMENELGREKSI